MSKYQEYKAKARLLDEIMEKITQQHHTVFTINDPKTGESLLTINRRDGTATFWAEQPPIERLTRVD